MRGIRDKAQTNEKTASCRRVHGGHEKILGNRKGEEWMRSFQISINRKTDGKRMGNGNGCNENCIRFCYIQS